MAWKAHAVRLNDSYDDCICTLCGLYCYYFYCEVVWIGFVHIKGNYVYAYDVAGTNREIPLFNYQSRATALIECVSVDTAQFSYEYTDNVNIFFLQHSVIWSRLCVCVIRRIGHPHYRKSTCLPHSDTNHQITKIPHRTGFMFHKMRSFAYTYFCWLSGQILGKLTPHASMI